MEHSLEDAKSAFHFDKPSTPPVQLVGQEGDELTPAGIAVDGLGQLMVFYHPADVQVFHNHHLVFVGDCRRQLVMEILALVGNVKPWSLATFVRCLS